MPLAEDLMALASLAGQTVVAAAVTDGWEGVKRGFAKLLGRGNADRAELMERRLDQTRHQLMGATDAELEQVGAVLEGQWVTRLTDLLEEDPDAEANLRALVAAVQANLPTAAAVTAATDHSVAAGRDVNITATSGGVAAAMIRGLVAPPRPTSPGPANR